MIIEPRFPDKVTIAHLPTVVEPLARLSDFLGGPRLLIKRDDQTGLATGGNKARKLEFLVADALRQGCDHIITSGAPQSNHCRQTAAAAARFGLKRTLVLRGNAPDRLSGNLLIDTLVGATVKWAGERSTVDVVEETAGQLRDDGDQPYIIPLGGSNVLGAIGYVLAMKELTGQLALARHQVDALVFATSSGGTQAGMVLGAHAYGFAGRVLGISVDRPAADLGVQVAALTTATAAHLGMGQLSLADRIEINDQYVGEGYSIMGELEREAISLLATHEGILVDPVYTGRALGGLIDLIRRGTFYRNQTILFWHTGGIPALWAYIDQLL